MLGSDLGSLAIKLLGGVVHLVDVGLQVVELTLHLSQIFDALVMAPLGFPLDVAAQLIIRQVVCEFSPLLESELLELDHVRVLLELESLFPRLNRLIETHCR